jgi:FAD/FMN-containing dehydrogenase
MTTSWHNWSGSVTARPESIRNPATLDEIVGIVREARARGTKVRVVGAGHSFTPLVETDGVLISLERYAGLESVDHVTHQATVRAGTTIKALSQALHSHGLAQENLGDIDVQSIAGAISTGTHGTGIALGSLSTQVVGLTLVNGVGEVVRCSEQQHRELFKAAQVSLGALGIITLVTLRLVPAYRLDYTWVREPLSATLERLDQERDANRHFEFFWFPYSTWALVKRMNTTQAPADTNSVLRQVNDLVIENGVFWLLSEIARRFPSTSAQVARLCGALISGGHDVNHSH